MARMKEMEERDLADQLLEEGYVHLYVWEDGPNVEYPEHHHRAESARWIQLHHDLVRSGDSHRQDDYLLHTTQIRRRAIQLQ